MDNLEERLEYQRTVIFELRELVGSRGWKRLEEYHKLVVMGRRNAIFGSDAGNMDALVQLGQMKSELAGIDFIMGAPEALLDEALLEEKAILMEMENDVDNAET